MDSKEWDGISKDYYTEILSPIRDSQNSPLLNDLKIINHKEKLSVADLGCGLGELSPFLSKYFNRVFCMDFSPKMIERAKKSNKDLSNVEFIVQDISDLREFYNSFDVITSINSILTPDLHKVDKIFLEIYNSLKQKGKFFCVLPSMEVFSYESLLLAQKEMDKKHEKKIEDVRKIVRSFIKRKEHDFLLGMTNFEGKQKAYYRFEILWRLNKAGFKNIVIKKIFYPWEEFEKAGQKAFPDEEMLPWDWYVIAEK
ncbi:MAG: class I SAM-dependent methyltransferase [archaeon]|nr:class I SAM-dependent methyltransferase [archaeon]